MPDPCGFCAAYHNGTVQDIPQFEGAPAHRCEHVAPGFPASACPCGCPGVTFCVHPERP